MYSDNGWGNKLLSRIKELIPSSKPTKISANKVQEPKVVSAFEELVELSRHSDGFKREHAVIRFGELNDPRAFCYLLVRANDWVPQVREAAIKSLLKLLTPQNVTEIIDKLPALYHLQKCSRGNHQVLIEEIERLLCREEHQNQVLEELAKGKRQTSRLCFRLVKKFENIDPESLLSLAFSHDDVLIRIEAIEWAKEHHKEALLPFRDRMLRDVFMPIRKEALRDALQGEQAMLYAKQALCDRQAPVRELALRYYQEQGGDALNLYRQYLSAGMHIRAALWGIGYLKSKEDIELVVGYLTSPYSPLRKQALNAILKLDLANAEVYLNEALKDSSPAVCKEAGKLSLRLRIRRNADDLLNIVASTKCQHNTNTCISLSYASNKWESLYFLLALLTDEKVVADMGEERLRGELNLWGSQFNTSFIPPDKKQKQRLLDQLEHPKLKASQINLEVLKSMLMSV